MVGAGRFERPTPCAQGRCATRLRYAPTFVASLILDHLRNLRHFPGCPNRPGLAACSMPPRLKQVSGGAFTEILMVDDGDGGHVDNVGDLGAALQDVNGIGQAHEDGSNGFGAADALEQFVGDVAGL